MDAREQRDHRRATLGPPRFGLGTLLLLVTAICIVLASYTWLGPYGASLVGLFVVAVLVHIAGNWLGTQLRDIGSHPANDERLDEDPFAQRVIKGAAEPRHFAPVTHLHARAPLSRSVLVTVVSAFAIGASGGALLVWLLTPRQPTWAMLLCGAAAFGVLAAIWTFVVAAFVHSGWKALSQATKEK